MSYLAPSTVNIILFGQGPPKPYQTHNIDLIGLLMDESGFLKSGSAKKSGSIRIGMFMVASLL